MERIAMREARRWWRASEGDWSGIMFVGKRDVDFVVRDMAVVVVGALLT